MQTIIQGHNKNILSTEKPTTEARCNCQVKSSCPVPGECCRPSVVYHATVNHDDGKTAEYIGCTEPKFKERYGNHKKSFRHADYKSETTLSKYVWDNDLNPTPNVTWKFLKNCSVYNTGNKSCDLCLSEKFYIIKNLHKKNIINKRTDIGNKCPHKRKCMFKRAVIWRHKVDDVSCVITSFDQSLEDQHTASEYDSRNQQSRRRYDDPQFWKSVSAERILNWWVQYCLL